MVSDNDYDAALAGWFSRGPDPVDEGAMFGVKKGPEHAAALERVREWTRERFKLTADAAILVSEIVCNLPGCPPLETAVVFWEGETRHHFKLFKPVEEVAYDNLPYAWMKESLILPEGFGCDCC